MADDPDVFTQGKRDGQDGWVLRNSRVWLEKQLNQETIPTVAGGSVLWRKHRENEGEREPVLVPNSEIPKQSSGLETEVRSTWR